MATKSVHNRQGKPAKQLASKPRPRPKISAANGKAGRNEFMLADNDQTPEPVLIVAEELPPSMRLHKPRKAAAAKTAAKPRARKPAAKKPVVAAVVAAPSIQLADLPRKMAPVVWKKNGPIDQLFSWCRSSGRGLSELLKLNRKGRIPVPRPNGVKLRTKSDLLRELAILRRENAVMRDRLGLPQMPFGRQIAEMI